MKRPEMVGKCSDGSTYPLSWSQQRTQGQKLLSQLLAWRGVKKGMLKTCDRCSFTSRKQTDFIAHHRHYRTFHQEKPEDLCLLCKNCHADLHRRYESQQLTAEDIPFVDPFWEKRLLAGLQVGGGEPEKTPSCPKCGSAMILRQPKPDQHWPAFWGCSNYPTCKGSQSLAE